MSKIILNLPNVESEKADAILESYITDLESRGIAADGSGVVDDITKITEPAVYEMSLSKNRIVKLFIIGKLTEDDYKFFKKWIRQTGIIEEPDDGEETA